MVTDLDMVMRLLAAALLGGIVGFERESHGRVAGFRTHILVCVGSALIMLTSLRMCTIYRGVAIADPGRIAAQVVTGVGFLGAGTILRFRASVRGLTTAASLWVVAGIGLAIGVGMFKAAALSTVLVILALYFFSKLEQTLVRKDWYKRIVIETSAGPDALKNIRDVLSKYHVEIKDFEIDKEEGKSTVRLSMDVKLLTNKENDKIIFDIMKLNGVAKAIWE
jgi:putative Mg2+ transporter-C (MgtC) family protein